MAGRSIETLAATRRRPGAGARPRAAAGCRPRSTTGRTAITATRTNDATRHGEVARALDKLAADLGDLSRQLAEARYFANDQYLALSCDLADSQLAYARRALWAARAILGAYQDREAACSPIRESLVAADAAARAGAGARSS